MSKSSPLLFALITAMVALSGCKKEAPTPEPEAQREAAIEAPAEPEEGPEEPEGVEKPGPQPVAIDKPAPVDEEAESAGETLDFDPASDGFGFENYGNEEVTNLTPAELRRLFGDDVCASIRDEECYPTPPAEQWMEEMNESMDGGHCEGLAVLSTLFYMGELEPAQFGAPTPGELVLEDNEALQREIAFWFVSQSTDPTASHAQGGDPASVVSKLREAFANDFEREGFTLGIYQPGFSGGHAITPFGLAERGEDKVAILVYDNNFPGEVRELSVDLDANTWSYVASTNPDEPESLYEGDAETKTLELTPTSVRLEEQLCPFCGELDQETGKLKGSKLASYSEVWLDGEADLLISDSNGKRIGHLEGKLVNEIPGAKIVPIRSASLLARDEEPVYRLPLQQAYSMELRSPSPEPVPTDLSIVSPAITLGVEELVLEPGQVDKVSVSESLRELTYTTTAKETPELIVGATTEAADYEFHVWVGGDDDGHEVYVYLDIVEGELELEIEGREGPAEYELMIIRDSDTGEDIFEHQGATLDDAARIAVAFATWEGDSSPMTVHIDEDDDGDYEQTLQLDDSNNQ